ncbi:FkbM family methyltransferase [Pseudorhodoplanes sp.]|uniref:FkbM family methyltransferase n=1 Tax=Pseudorhodoplanes sp. TaxID=1934341 RepID=UPI002C9A4DB9|nr:FkbM family methyltransferase [Pseudorhodoplanes sp.]HWV51194.1 FkbM family methyltransferase [Pseudorhodoplanes sp.]
MLTAAPGTISATLERLFKKEVRYSTVIDVGCADGQFFLDAMPFFPDATPLNIDANRLYEPSLQAIKDAVGGNYRICAITDFVGEIEITESAHPYWSSIRPEGDPYWSRINDLIKDKSKVAATTLDTLAEELLLKPPYLLKLDVQGAEKSALIGARSVLENTHAVICEADIDDFQEINGVLKDAGFYLYDLTTLSRIADGTLGWFYPVYLNNRLADLRAREFWDTKDNDAIINMQLARRAQILKSNSERLARLRYSTANVGRNDVCPCGSGRKFKHCCGTYKA